MVTVVTDMELSVINNNMLRKSHKDIASLLDMRIEDVAFIIKGIVDGTNIVTYQMKIDCRRKLTAKQVIEKIKNIDDRKIENQIIHELREKNKRNNEPKFKMKHVDYSQLRTVRIDAKTVIYAKPGEDIQELKKDFLFRYEKSFKKAD